LVWAALGLLALLLAIAGVSALAGVLDGTFVAALARFLLIFGVIVLALVGAWTVWHRGEQ
jgi:hypothetical protein